MSYCLKTGGLLLNEVEQCVYECDLHIHGNVVIAVTCKAQYEFNENDPHIMLTIPANADYFYRDMSPYGVLVVDQADCILSASLQNHIAQWYTSKTFDFDKANA